MTLQEHLKSANVNVVLDRTYREILPRIRCSDGLELSVQAGHTHYCSPRDDFGPWYEVELGYPSEAVEEFMPYAEDKDNPTGTVYGYVPITLVERILEERGGFVVLRPEDD